MACLCYGSAIANGQSVGDVEFSVDKVDARERVGFNLVYELRDDESLATIVKVVKRSILKLLAEKTLSFERLMGRDFTLNDTFRAHVYRDIYMDTQDFLVLSSGSAYRLRHRWNGYELYLQSRFLPFIRKFYPDRCEIQFQTADGFLDGQNLASPRESRFEFRNEAAHFEFDKDAPPPPWPEKEYVGHAASGRYKDVQIKPMTDLLDAMGKSADFEPSLHPVVEVITLQDRINLQLKNPWGSGQNPEQVFVIALEKATLGRTFGHQAPEISFLELAVEIEGNFGNEIRKLIDLGFDDNIRFAEVKNAAVKHSAEAWDGLLLDLDELRLAIAQGLAQSTTARSLPLASKYSRIMGIILEHPTANKPTPLKPTNPTNRNSQGTERAAGGLKLHH